MIKRIARWVLKDELELERKIANQNLRALAMTPPQEFLTDITNRGHPLWWLFWALNEARSKLNRLTCSKCHNGYYGYPPGCPPSCDCQKENSSSGQETKIPLPSTDGGEGLKND